MLGEQVRIKPVKEMKKVDQEFAQEHDALCGATIAWLPDSCGYVYVSNVCIEAKHVTPLS